MPLVALLVVAAAAQSPVSSAGSKLVPGRSIVASRYGVVASSQPLAAQAAAQILERGGNAVDAAIAANATIGVMEPTGSGIGGDLFVLVYTAKDDKIHGLNSSGWSPKAMTVEFLRGKGIADKIPQRGPFTVTVPGVVAGWDALQKKFGTRPLSVLLAPAIFYAEQGFPVMEITAGLWARSEKLLSEHPNSRSTFLVDGSPPRAGQIFRNPDLARSLRRIAEHGRDGYYQGPTAQAIVDIVREQGGAMELDDLSAFQPEWVQPIETTYRGWTVTEIPPNSQGIAALEMLNVLERFPLGEWGFHSTRALHAMIEAKKLAYADLIRYVGDPRFGRMPVADLLGKEGAAARAEKIDPHKASCKVEPTQLAAVTGSPENFPICTNARCTRGSSTRRGSASPKHMMSNSALVMSSVAAWQTVWPGAPDQLSFSMPSETRNAGSPMISAASEACSISGKSGSASVNCGEMRHFSAQRMRVRTCVLRELLSSAKLWACSMGFLATRSKLRT